MDSAQVKRPWLCEQCARFMVTVTGADEASDTAPTHACPVAGIVVAFVAYTSSEQAELARPPVPDAAGESGGARVDDMACSSPSLRPRSKSLAFVVLPSGVVVTYDPDDPNDPYIRFRAPPGD